MTNEEWVAGFQLFIITLIVIGAVILLRHDIQVEHTNCINDGGQWVHGLITNGDLQYYCIEPPGM